LFEDALSRPRSGCGIVLNAYGAGYADRALVTASYIRRLVLPQGWCGEIQTDTYVPITIFTDANILPATIAGIEFVFLPAVAAELAMKSFPEMEENFHETPMLWWKRIVALANSPYELTIALDLDSLPRTGEALADAFGQLRTADLFTVEAPSPYGGSFNNPSTPAPPWLTEAEAADWSSFPERNLGLVGWNLASETTRSLVLLFARAFVREIDSGAAVHGDQTAFREALFLHEHVYASGLYEHRCEPKTCCRHDVTTACAWVHDKEESDVMLHSYSADHEEESVTPYDEDVGALSPPSDQYIGGFGFIR
jgi:hypothetical protein